MLNDVSVWPENEDTLSWAPDRTGSSAIKARPPIKIHTLVLPYIIYNHCRHLTTLSQLLRLSQLAASVVRRFFNVDAQEMESMILLR